MLVKQKSFIDLYASAIAIADKHPKEKFLYRLECKLKYEFQKIFASPDKKQLPNLANSEFPKYFCGIPSYSESLQDLFVLAMTGNKIGGHYLEVGSGPAIKNNNTFLLENNFGWKGLSIDLNQEFVYEFKNLRKNWIECGDAVNFPYLDKLREYTFPAHIDYLQIDIDPSYQSLVALFKIPFSEYKFATITFEHDLYRTSTKIAKIARKKLVSEGYELVIKNVPAGRRRPFEDWWIHPDLVDKKMYADIKSIENLKLSLD